MQTNLERFRNAAMVLAGSGPVKQRLAQAFHAHLGTSMPTICRGNSGSVLRARGCAPPYAADRHARLRLGQHPEDVGDSGCEHAQSIVLMFGSLHEAPPATAARPSALLRAVPDDRDPGLRQSSLNSITSKRVVSS